VRQIVKLRFSKGLDYRAVAEQIGRPVASTRQTLYRALVRLSGDPPRHGTESI